MRFALAVLAVLGGGGCSAILDFEWTSDAGPPAPDADVTPDAAPIAPDMFEPNETDAAATATAAGTYPNLSIFPAADVDFFTFTTTTMGDATIEAQFDYLAGDLDLYLYRFDAAQAMLVEVDHSTNFDQDESLTVVALPPAQYWIKVQSFDNAFTNSYTLVVTVPP